MIGYSSFYLLKQNFSLAIPSMIKDLHYTKTELGSIVTVGAILYGILKCFFGLISDKKSARYVMSIGLLCSALMNICMGFSSLIPIFTIFWTLNYCFQAMGMPPCAKLLRHWFSPTEIGTRWSFWSWSHEIGRSIIALISSPILIYFGWRYMFFFPAAVAIVLSVFLFNRLRDTPESMGLPSIEEMAEIVVTKEKKFENKEKKLSYSEILKMVFSNKSVWIICIANFFLYFGKMTFLTWGATFLIESKSVSLITASFCMAAFDIAGMLGAISAGYISDKVFKGRRGPVSTVCMTIFTGLVALLLLAPNSYWVCAFCMMGSGFILSGPQVLIGIAATDFVSKKAAGTANGFTGTLGYIGTAVAGVGTGALVDHYGWNSVFLAIIIASFISAILLSLTWNKKAEVLIK
jgi:sugar phosphate permease